MKQLELLAPARNAESAFAAIDYGADAIYIGASLFGARQSAGNSVEDIARTVEYAHRYGVRVHATFNTLIYERELADAERMAREVVAAGVDALIVQDMAFTQMGLPVELHASTQLFNTSAERIKFLQDVGFARVVLERALTLEQIALIRSVAPKIELESFVHGAICVGMSGRCYLSKALSSRSGNRGDCMQACRLNFDLVTQSGREIIKGKHLLSVKDLNLTDRVGELIDAGVTSFKVEGRLKEIGYTKNIVAHYRAVIDRAIAQRSGFERSSQGVSHVGFVANPSKSFSRGESTYLLDGQQRGLSSFDTPKSTGELIGEVRKTSAKGFVLSGSVDLSAGDGVCYKIGDEFVGTNINAVNGREVFPNRVDKLRVGTPIYRNYDKSFNDLMERSRGDRRVEVSATLSIMPSRLTLAYRDIYGNIAEQSVEGDFPQANSPEKMESVIRSQIGKCGDTEFTVSSVDIDGDVLFVASSLLGQLRRDTIEKLRQVRVNSLMPPPPFRETEGVEYPLKSLSGEDNVVNSLSRKFYTSHGVEQIAKGWDIESNLDGTTLMQSRYCIRFEIGECLKRGSKLREELFLQHGKERLKLEFDCKMCQMNILYGKY